MELKIQRITKFKTPDQKEFFDEEEAKSHMKNQFVRVQILLQMSKNPKLMACLEDSTIENTIENVVDFIIQNKNFIINLFSNTESIEVE